MTSQPLVTINGGDVLTTTSLDISHHFGRKHKTVLDAINNVQCSQEFARQNFLPGTYQDSNRQSRPMYTITRDGFVFLCMGFTGPQAALWKERYIQAFNEMEEELIRRRVEHALPQAETVHRLERQVKQLALEAVKVNPEWQKIQRYREKGLNQREIAKLLDRSDAHIRNQLHKMAACGLVDYTPNPLLMQAGRKGHDARFGGGQ